MKYVSIAALIIAGGCAPRTDPLTEACLASGNDHICRAAVARSIAADNRQQAAWSNVTAAGLVLMTAPHPVYVGQPAWSPEPPGVSQCWRHGC